MSVQQSGLLERLGIPRPLIFGFIGLTIFMIGDGVETNILEPFLSSEHGFSVSLAGTLVTVYGVAVAIAAFFSGGTFGPVGSTKSDDPRCFNLDRL